jgi:hypothetical protein
MINDLVINGFRDLPDQTQRYANAIRSAFGRDEAENAFDRMVAEQRNTMAQQLQRGELRLPNYNTTPFPTNEIDDRQDLERGRGALRIIRDQMVREVRLNLNRTPEQMASLVADAKRRMNYEPNGISPLNLPAPTTPAAATRLSPEVLQVCNQIKKELEAISRAPENEREWEGGNALNMQASMLGCPQNRGAPRRR